MIELGNGRIHFTHPLLASGAYAGVEASERRANHARLAELVHDPEERARHLALAVTVPDARVAAALDAAAELAHARGAPATAGDLRERAAQLTPTNVPRPAAGSPTPPTITSSWATAAAPANVSRHYSHERHRALERARVLTRLARVRAYDDDLRAPIDLDLQAIVEAGDDEAVRAQAHEGVAAALFKLRERLAEAVNHAEAVVAIARDVGNEVAPRGSPGSQLLSEATLGRDSARATLDEALAHQPACEHMRLLAQPKFQCAVVWMRQEEVERARAAFRELSERGREIGDEGSLPYVLVLLAQADCLAGEFELARRHAEEGYDWPEQAGQASLEAYLLAVGALVDAHLGRADTARDAGERALALAGRMSARPAHMFATAALGLLELSLGSWTRPSRT